MANEEKTDGCYFCEAAIRHNAWPLVEIDDEHSVVRPSDGFAVCERCAKRLEASGLFKVNDF